MARQPIDSEALEDRIAEQVTPPDVPSPRRPRLSRRARAWLAGGLVGLVTAGSIGFVLLRSTTATTASTYRTVTVARDTLKQTVSASGTIQPARRADLTFTSAGEVTSVQVEVGDTVRAGDGRTATSSTTRSTGSRSWTSTPTSRPARSATRTPG